MYLFLFFPILCAQDLDLGSLTDLVHMSKFSNFFAQHGTCVHEIHILIYKYELIR